MKAAATRQPLFRRSIPPDVEALRRRDQGIGNVLIGGFGHGAADRFRRWIYQLNDRTVQAVAPRTVDEQSMVSWHPRVDEGTPKGGFDLSLTQVIANRSTFVRSSLFRPSKKAQRLIPRNIPLAWPAGDPAALAYLWQFDICTVSIAVESDT